jgi:hypothetical protein
VRAAELPWVELWAGLGFLTSARAGARPQAELESDVMASATLEPRKVMPDRTLSEAEFKRRFRSQFSDPAYDPLSAELDRVAAIAWDSYSNNK